MLCLFSSRAYSLSGGYHALRYIHPSTHSRRHIRPIQAARLPDQSRVPWLSERLDARSGAELHTDPGSARTHDLRRVLHRTAVFGVRGLRQPIAQSSPPGQKYQHTGSVSVVGASRSALSPVAQVGCSPHSRLILPVLSLASLKACG